MSQIPRPYWINRIEQYWKKTPIVWLAGVRRSGKTTLARLLPDTTYVNCDLPSSRALLLDPESFYAGLRTGRVVFDEIHQLENPGEILKIGADENPSLRILATGSSTLFASRKFKDTLTGRKRSIRFVPFLPEELESFDSGDLRDRIFRGGLPPALLSDAYDPELYGEWMDSFFARDIQELFSIEKRQPFLKLLELLLVENGSMLDVTRLGKYAGISRPTVVRYLEALEATQAISLVRPFFKNSAQALVHQPKVYGFDTGFSVFCRGWRELRDEDCGHYLENLTLESLQATPTVGPVHYWRTKQKKEIDFVLPSSRSTVHTIECKWKAASFSPDHLISFRDENPKGLNFVVCSDAHRPYCRTIQGLTIRYVHITNFRKEVSEAIA